MNARLKQPSPHAPDDEPSIYDDWQKVEDALNDAGIPDYLASYLGDWALAGYSEGKWLEIMRDVQRHVQPILEAA